MIDHCIRLAEPEVRIVYLYSNLVTFIAYIVIASIIAYVKLKRPDIVSQWISVTFTAFIFLCGVSHLFNVITLEFPVYGLMAFENSLMAAASIFTAAGMLLQLKRVIKSYPSIDEYERATEQAQLSLRLAEEQKHKAEAAARETALANEALQLHVSGLESTLQELRDLRPSLPPRLESNYDALLKRAERLLSAGASNGK